MVNFSRSVLKILHRAEKIYTDGARGARDKYEVCEFSANSDSCTLDDNDAGLTACHADDDDLSVHLWFGINHRFVHFGRLSHSVGGEAQRNRNFSCFVFWIW